MSATLVARDLSAAFGPRSLFDGLDLVVAGGDVVGLVGANGAGKSTLLRLLAAADPALEGTSTPSHANGVGAPSTSGTIRLTPPGATIGLLPQEPQRRPGESVRVYLARRTGVADADARLQWATRLLAGEEQAEPGIEAGDVYAEALERWLALGGADLDDRIPAVAAQLGLGVDLDTPMTALSGGEAARTGLAALLLSRYDVFLLDEPTNDLDLDGLARLEEFVAGLRAPVVVVSHDREFLARTVTTVVELDLAQHQVNVFGGGYGAYLEEREVARRHARETYEEYAETRAGLEERARTQRAWMDKGVRNARRKATDPDKFVKHHRGEVAEKQAAKARQTERLIQRLDVVEEPRKEWQLRMEIAVAPRSGAIVAVLNGAVVHRGGPDGFTLGPVDLQIDWADRLAITGANGSGKTTLVQALLGRIPLDAGTAHLGPGVVLGEVDQARARFAGTGTTLLRAFGDCVSDWAEADVRTLLAKYGLTAEHVLRDVAGLSPGERTRAGLALLQAQGVNLLVLDEPTNHLDLPAIEQLEQALDSFPGTLVLISHDRRLMEQVRLTRRLEVTAGVVRELPADGPRLDGANRA